MRLKKIEVLGFKSFADRQVVHVDDHVTGVIGPNGCGKSNIVDAIRWAMGEQSAKHLRGSGMADVIFAGCSSRGPAGVAEVTLTFLNGGNAPPPWSDVPEIALTRRLFADGTSEYLINKVPARLRDISDLLAGTGVGTKGYSIIEQGQVGKIVSSKPEDRRSIIDEAAGITRFKAQKAAAARKIEATRQNLLRVRDVVAELEDRLGTLRRQAQKAERYKKYRSELRDLELWQAAQRLLELHAMRGVLDARRGNLGQQIDDVRASLSARDAQIATLRLQLGEIEAELTERQQKVYDLDNRVRLAEAEDDYRRREREAALQSATAARAEAEVANRAAAQLQAELGELDDERNRLGDGTGEGGEHELLARLHARYERTEAELWTERSRNESGARELGERRSGLAATRARAEALAESVEDLRARETSLRDALASTEATRDELASSATRLVSERAAIEAVLTVAREQKSGLERQRAELRERIASAEVELDTGRAELHRARSRLQSLEEIQARYRGCASGVQVVMEHRDELEASPEGGVSSSSSSRAVLGIVADHIEVPEHLESALSAVLGERLEGVVVEGTDDAARGVALLKRAQEGRLSFLPRDCRAPAGPTVHAEGTNLGWRDPAKTPRLGIELVDISGDGEPPRWAPKAIEIEEEPSRAASPEQGVLGRLVDLIRCGTALGDLPAVLLGDTVVVDGLARALELWQSKRVA
ncbi:MAG TPA: AAA family ATPase, partial [Nannocystaceae bacterium]|nr:AAA family ATPase [Nannocystaceae bacterium]